MDRFLESLSETLGPYAVKAISVLLLIVIGWLIAVLVRMLVNGLLSKVGLNKRVQTGGEAVQLPTVLDPSANGENRRIAQQWWERYATQLELR